MLEVLISHYKTKNSAIQAIMPAIGYTFLVYCPSLVAFSALTLLTGRQEESGL